MQLLIEIINLIKRAVLTALWVFIIFIVLVIYLMIWTNYNEISGIYYQFLLNLSKMGVN